MNLKQMELNAWKTNFIDGTTDIGIGILIGISTILRFSDVSLFHILWMIPPAIAIGLAYKYITKPRIGTVKFSKERKRKDRIFVLIAAIILTILFTIVFYLIAKDWIGIIPYPRLVVGVVLFTIWCSIAYFRDFPRLYLYSLLMTISFLLTGTNTQDNPLGVFAWTMTSIIMVAIGIYLFVIFIKKYPKED